MARCCLFATHEVEGAKGKRMLRGKDAVLSMYRACSTHHEKAGYCEIKDLEELGRWLFILDASQQKAFDSMIQAAIVKASAAGGATAARASASGVKRKVGAEETAEKAKAKRADMLDKDMDALFGKS